MKRAEDGNGIIVRLYEAWGMRTRAVLSVPGSTRAVTPCTAMEDACGEVGIRVYKGAELRFDECDNDYLLYGWQDELLRDMPRNLQMSVVEFSKLAREAGALLIQAHPYRKKCTPAIACYLDGVEVINAHPRHESHNDWAKAYAEQFGLIQTAGSDCHQTPDIARSGILSDTLPADTFEFADLIRSGNYTLIEPPKAE